MLKSETFSTTNSLFSNFFPQEIYTHVTRRNIDFSLRDVDEPFGTEQAEYLKSVGIENTDRVINIKQVHGNQIACIKEIGDSMHSADGIITSLKNVTLVIRTADCLPIFLYAPDVNVIGLIHAGWRGSKEKIVINALDILKDQYGCRISEIKVAFGPCIRRENYEVGEELKGCFPEEVQCEDGRYFLDLARVNYNQLISRGVLEKDIFDSQICTYQSQYYFSYRREGVPSGRILSMMTIKDY